MTTLNGLPAHILLVHAIVVLLPLTAVLLVLCVFWPVARQKLAGANALLSLLVVILVPITTDAGEWLERRVPASQLLRDHTELGDSALFFAIPVAVLAIVVWWRQRESVTVESQALEQESAAAGGSTQVKSRAALRRTYLAPASKAVTMVVAVLAVLAAGASIYGIYRIGDSGAQATWQGKFSTTPAPRGQR